jgi:hypothetical protein
MGFWDTVADVVFGSAKVVAKGVSKTAKFGYEHRDTIGSAVAATAKVAGTAVKGVGSVVAEGATAATKSLANNASQSGSVAGKALGVAVISLSVFLYRSLTPEQRAAAIGERVGRAGVYRCRQGPDARHRYVVGRAHLRRRDEGSRTLTTPPGKPCGA